jgi:hypothetical protein
VALSAVFQAWAGGQPDFWANTEQTAETANNGAQDWNDLPGEQYQRYVVCKAWS